MSSNNQIEIPSTRKSFVINSEHADMIVNDLLQGDYEALGRIFTDLVNFNLYGDFSIVETECNDKAERSARKLLKSDSEHYIAHYKGRSEQNAKNRLSGQRPDRDEVKEYARLKGYDENIAMEWCLQQATNDWLDNKGEPIKYWKKTLDAYMKAVNLNKLNSSMKGMFKL